MAEQLSPNDVRQVWDGTYLPLLRCVDVPNGLTTSDEAERLAVLADPQSKFGDPDDVPTATLASLLGAPLLSRDRNPLRAVYGSGFDHVEHGKWLDRVRAGGDLAPLGSFLQGMRMLTVGVGVGGCEGLRALARRVSWPWLLLGGLVSAGTLNLLVPTDTKRHVQSALGTGLVAATKVALEVTELHTTARRHFESLSPAQPTWANVVAQRDADAALARACLHFLARSPRSDLSAAELSQQLSSHLESPHGETKVRKTLRELPCFDQPYQGRFQLGRALVTAEQTAP